jgi:serine/threonine protein kinase
MEISQESSKIGDYELTQPVCFVNDNYDPVQLSHYLSGNLGSFLLNIDSTQNLKINVIGSPSDAGFVFKLTFNGITIHGQNVHQCYALKIMPYTTETPNNDSELFFAEFVSQLNPDRFALLYYKVASVNLQSDSANGVINVPLSTWYRSGGSSKIVKHKAIYDKVLEFNATHRFQETTFLCDIIVSRLYWGDLIAFINNEISPITSITEESKTSRFTRCNNIDYCGILKEIKNNIFGWKQMLTTILETIYLMREKNIIHNDLHCGNILLDFNGQPIIHDFGKTMCYMPPENQMQLFYMDTLDFRKLINALYLETSNHTLNEDVYSYIKNLSENVNRYVSELFDTTQPETEFGLTVLEIEGRTYTFPENKMSEELKSTRDDLFKTLIMLVNTDYTEVEFNKEKFMAEIGLPSDITYDEFKNVKTKRKMVDKITRYNEIKQLWEESLKTTAGGSRLSRKIKINKKRKTKKRRKHHKKSKRK